MQCKCCDTWQHYHCYGFLTNAPSEEHFCYQCLLEESNEASLNDLRRLAQFRRALFILYEKEPHSQNAFMKLLGRSAGDVIFSLSNSIIDFDARAMRELVRRLKNEGFLTTSTGGNLTLVKTAEQEDIKHRGYSNPMTYIDNHVSNSLVYSSWSGGVMHR